MARKVVSFIIISLLCSCSGNIKIGADAPAVKPQELQELTVAIQKAFDAVDDRLKKLEPKTKSGKG